MITFKSRREADAIGFQWGGIKNGDQEGKVIMVKTPRKGKTLGPQWGVNKDPLVSDYNCNEVITPQEPIQIDQTPNSSDSVQYCGTLDSDSSKFHGTIDSVASEDSIQHYGTHTLGSASSKDSVQHYETINPSTHVKLKTTSVLSKVKEEPAEGNHKS